MIDNVDHKICPTTGDGTSGHAGWYGKVGFSPCGEYVAHESNKPCNVIDGTIINENPIDKSPCECKTDYCSCGEFLSHKISEPCTAKL